MVFSSRCSARSRSRRLRLSMKPLCCFSMAASQTLRLRAYSASDGCTLRSMAAGERAACEGENGMYEMSIDSLLSQPQLSPISEINKRHA